jgi:hypothetical protein
MQIKKQIGDTLSYTMNIQDLKELWWRIFKLEVRAFQWFLKLHKQFKFKD